LLDLAAPARCHLKLKPIFITFRGPEALTDTLEKIHFQCFLGQQSLQPMHLLPVRRFMRVRPWCFFSWLEVIEFGLPLVETPSAYAQFFR
jgi:hypothetical protein